MLNKKWNNRYLKAGITAFLVIVASLLFYYLLFHASNMMSTIKWVMNVFMPIFFGCILAYLLTPILNFIEGKFLIPVMKKLKIEKTKETKKLIRGISVVLTTFFFFFIIYGLFTMLLSQIVPSIQSIVMNFDTYVANFTIWLNQILANNPGFQSYAVNIINRYSTEIDTFLDTTLISMSSELIKTVSLSILNVLVVFWDFIIGFIISIYLLSSKEKFASQSKKVLYSIFERDTSNIIINNFRFTHNTFIGFISGKLLDSVIIGLLCFIGTSILGTPYAVLVSLIIGVTNVIPFFGPYLGAIPCSILILIVDPMNPLNVVYFVIFILILQQVDGNIIGPKILGESTGLASFWVIFSITIFGGFFGILGMIVGVPIFAVIYAAIKSLVNTALIKRELPIESSKYLDVECIDEFGFHTGYQNIKKSKKSEEKNILPRSGSKYVSSIVDWNYKYGQTYAIKNKSTNQTLKKTDFAQQDSLPK